MAKEERGGKMVLSGMIHVAGPDIIERLTRDGEVVIDQDKLEFILKVEHADEDRVVAFDPLVWIAEADVKIGINLDDGPDDMAAESLSISEREGKKVDLDISLAQAEAIIKVLSSYVAAYRAIETLDQDLRVNAA